MLRHSLLPPLSLSSPRVRALLGALALGGVAACAEERPQPVAPEATPTLGVTQFTGEFMLLGENGILPADLTERVQAADGTVVRIWAEIGVALAASSSQGFPAAAIGIPGIQSAVQDVTLQWTAPEARVADLPEDLSGPAPSSPTAQVASLADNEPFYALQWAPAAIQTPEAWNAGYTGSGVRVAILDGGLYNAHQDLAANVDVAASRSFVPGQAYNQETGTFWHGTHVAGIVGARDNRVGVIGIAPNATLIGVKVLHNGSGSFAWMINGILYAARPQSEGGAGAQVINMSLGATIDGKNPAIKQAVKELSKAFDRATRYAHEHGVTLIAAAGNDATSFDAEKVLVTIPGMSAYVLGISATGPVRWAYGAQNFSRPASYTNYGKAVVSLAAPGGDAAYPGNENCTVASITRPCWVFDLYLSTSRGTTTGGAYSWAAGTSMASPVVAGIAALIVEANGGTLEPAEVAAKLRQGAQDLGKPGKDEFYGHGWVNA